MAKPKLPTGLSDFEQLRTDTTRPFYVDKTADIYRLATEGTFYFMGRPRRFGKSLLLSTLKSLFEGRKDLFEGLWIATQTEEDPWDWEGETRPVIHIDFSEVVDSTVPLADSLSRYLTKSAAKHGVTLSEGGVGEQFSQWIDALYEQAGKPVAILIDEYDKGITDYLHKPERALANRETLKSFYTILKGKGGSIRLLFLTGVSKFGKMALFSGLNNLTDISISAKYGTLLGYTDQEIDQYFTNWLVQWAEAEGEPFEDVRQQLRRWYNGYSFDGRTKVYNPWSVLQALNAYATEPFWYVSGTPTMLIELFKQQEQPVVQSFGKTWVRSYQLDQTNLEHVDLVALLWQTGYLTIADRKKLPSGDTSYRLDFPNIEVRTTLLSDYFQFVMAIPRQDYSPLVPEMYEAIEAGDLASFFGGLDTLLAKIPHQLHSEANYHAVAYIAMQLLGLQVQAEVSTTLGRADAVLETTDTIYVIEFKVAPAAGAAEEAAQQALAQIEAKGYATPYRKQGKTIKAIGLAFDTTTRQIGRWLAKEMP